MTPSFRTNLQGAVFFILTAIIATVYGQIPTIHVTDLYHPHADPDDHWDLATQYALACAGEIDLEAVLIDYTRTAILNGHDKRPFGDPDVVGVMMMNMLIGRAIPVMVGSPHLMKQGDAVQQNASVADLSGIEMVLGILRKSPEPVTIHITGTSRDIAIAGKKDPELFRRKCKAIYLNAGTAFGPSGDCNVKLDPVGFTALFDLPCPIYWLPCLQGSREPGKRPAGKGEYASWYKFQQESILPNLSHGMQNFFAYMFRHGRTQLEAKPREIHWARYLNGPVEKDVITEQASRKRSMWCTAGFFHAAGKTVTRKGRLMPVDEAYDSAVFHFEPVRLTVEGTGRPEVKWSRDPAATNRFILHVTDTKHYEPAMGLALKTTLESAPWNVPGNQTGEAP